MPSSVPTRRFGRTELQIPVFSCGGMRYQYAWNDDKADEISSESQRNLEATIERSLELGIFHIETARGYGTSELQLGRILPRLPREKMLVQTKVGPGANGKEFSEHFETSMRNLGLDYVDFLGIHGINTDEILEKVLAPDGALAAARVFQREGRCRFIGFSTHGPCRVNQKTIRTGEFDYANLHWYFVNDSNWPAILDAEKEDLGLFIISPNDKGGKLYEPTEKMNRLCAPLTPMAFNDLYCLSRPQVHTLSLGAARPTDFDAHIEALKHYDDRATLSEQTAIRIREAMAEALGADWCARWEEGLPEWEEVPGGVNLWEILRLWNYAKALDMVAFGKMRYNLLGNAEHWFPGENVLKLEGHDLGPALKDSPFADRIPGLLQEAHALLYEAPKKRLSESD